MAKTSDPQKVFLTCISTLAAATMGLWFGACTRCLVVGLPQDGAEAMAVFAERMMNWLYTVAVWALILVGVAKRKLHCGGQRPQQGPGHPGHVCFLVICVSLGALCFTAWAGHKWLALFLLFFPLAAGIILEVTTGKPSEWCKRAVGWSCEKVLGWQADD